MLVSCNLPTGLRLKVGDEEVGLKPGPNEVEDGFWSAWFDGLPATDNSPEYPNHHDFAPILDGSIVAHVTKTDPAPVVEKAKPAPVASSEPAPQPEATV